MSQLDENKDLNPKRLRQTTLNFTFVKKRKRSTTDDLKTSSGEEMLCQTNTDARGIAPAEVAKNRACMHDNTSSHETKDLSHYSSPKEQKTVALSRYELAGPSHLSKSMDLGEVNAASGDEETMIDNSSQPLFSESDSQDDTQPMSENNVWFGTPLSQLKRAPQCSSCLGQLQPERHFKILFKPKFTDGSIPKPFPDNYQDRWDSNHVRMPCSSENLYPVEAESGKKEVKSRWELIQSSLLHVLSSSVDLEESILHYNTRYNKRWNFEALHHYFTEVLDREESSYFFASVLPGMVQLALELPNICTQPIPLLKQNINQTIFLSQQQLASLLANAFFCTFPRRNAQQKKSEYAAYPDINFNRLFDGRSARKQEKLKCIINYFRRVITKTPCGTVSFTRRSIHSADTYPNWEQSQAKFGKLHVSSVGKIETEGTGMLQLDFANSSVGGGVLGQGCVQEEIRFLICPELIVSRLFTEVLGKHECLIIKGAEQYNSYSGYANSFRWTGNHADKTPRDKWRRRETEIVALDALHFRQAEQQYQPEKMKRELNKAFCGFNENDKPEAHVPAVATGNWGCGAFGGNPRLKALIQLMAAAETKRDVAYFTFHDKTLCQDIHNMHVFLQSQEVSVGWCKHAMKQATSLY
ncbi:putative poly(ADP-ribose) glycohydrolase [Apostichopus japonicus]|uniref:poly(ADP-ribose) glycohydrolase n=1 Tax=Stichopus japonicus TaxID=307972 RepID=A0A2G8K0Z3_STIJA|nr:putative poly(ADP-ribose) glycohydrolase [Apostichopus japonicus]